MYVVTFYSFKGGVGRSMALVNVGYQLAQAGRTVLLVDFDLEAPGLPTFNLQRPSRIPGGIVDYVHDYLLTGEAPNVGDYIYRSEAFPDGGTLWVMPAGKSDDQYASRFQSIDWQELYENHNGYLLMEELKEQWRTTIQPDYVLIDSRTGHTDIAGICTRQLPDAVCILFFPNDQNLAGLKRVAGDIRAERRDSSQAPKQPIALHFVVSNVPTLDDEERIVANRLRTFSEQLDYKALAAQIHHYDSLALVNQLVFSRDRPNSYLTQEYRTLTEAIRRENLQDRDTALETLRRMARGARGAGRWQTWAPELPDARLKDIAATFERDGEISFWLGMAWRISGDPGTALLLFNRAIENGYDGRDVYLERGTLHRDQQNTEAAAEDFWRVLELENLPALSAQVILSVRALLDIGEKDVQRLAGSWAVAHLESLDCARLAERIDDSETGLELTSTIITRLLSRSAPDARQSEILGHHLGLALIGLGRFEEAKRALNPHNLPASIFEQAKAFNLAMAEWGLTGHVDQALFGRVVELDNEQRPKQSANYFQCLALAHWALESNAAAQTALERARRISRTQFTRDFSAWRYMKVGPDEFLKDLEDIRCLIDGQKRLPLHMRRQGSEGSNALR